MSARDYTTRVLRPIVNDGKIHRPGELVLIHSPNIRMSMVRNGTVEYASPDRAPPTPKPRAGKPDGSA